MRTLWAQAEGASQCASGPALCMYYRYSKPHQQKLYCVQQYAHRRGGVGGSVARGSTIGNEAALQLIADREQADVERLRQCGLALEQARYEATYARRQYDSVDPDNRLVAGELERRWNECLAAQARLEEQMENP
jgi:hypothetical protein